MKSASRKLSLKSRSLRRRRVMLEALESRNLMAFGNTIANFPGLNQRDGLDVDPPDTIGAVGPNHFVQAINHSSLGSMVAVYDKTTGAELRRFAMGSITPGLGGGCSGPAFSVTGTTGPGGDPIVLYDDAAGRFVLMEFAAGNILKPGIIDTFCVHVSQTADPTNGLFFSYRFQLGEFPDFEKLGVSGNAYTATANDIIGPGVNTPSVFAFDRERMLQGLPVRSTIRFAAQAVPGFGFQTLTPVDVDGPASANLPGMFMRYRDEEGETGIGDAGRDFLEIFELAANFDRPQQSSFRLSQRIDIQDFDALKCGSSSPTGCVSQPGGGIALDPGPPSIQYKVQYRNFGDHEAMVGAFTVNTGRIDSLGNTISTTHWFETRRTPASQGQWSLYQEGDVPVPDGANRWMAAIAMDALGNMAIGYNISSPSVAPGIRYRGRLAGDPLGTLPRGEHVIIHGNGAKFDTGGARWGDYSALSLDPVDGITFWFTGEYADGGPWATQIASFNFAEEVQPPGPPQPQPADATAIFSGTKFLDANRNAAREASEKGLAGFIIYADLNNNRRLDLNEPASVTAADGSYQINVKARNSFYSIRESVPPGWTQTFPTSRNGSAHVIVIDPNITTAQTFTNLNFGNAGQVMDFGDAPLPYPVTLAEDGARYGMLEGLRLGVLLDGEGNGIHGLTANADNVTGLNDEDGVFFTSPIVAGGTATVDVIAEISGFAPGRLQGFIDFNRDGDWNDPGEQIFKDLKLDGGVHSLSFPVPSDTQAGPSFARFRYGYESGIGPTGVGLAGEVEDYGVTLQGGIPDAIDDGFTVTQNTTNNLLDVLGNDFISSKPPLLITAVGTPTVAGSSVTISTDKLSVLYTPANGYFGVDSFTYTITDAAGRSDRATVTMNVLPLIPNPIAIDDDFSVTPNIPAGINSFTLQVLANDLPGVNPPVRVFSVTQPANGTVNIASGNTAVVYIPNANFNNLDQFTYTIQDAAGNRSTATVSVQVNSPNAAADDLVAYSYVITDLNGNQISSVSIGDQFKVTLLADDLRTADPNTSTPADDRGVFAAYVDTIFDPRRAAFVSIDFAQQYPAVRLFNTDIPGLINDAGASQSGGVGLGPNPVSVFTLTLRATGAGAITFQSDPTELSPTFDTLFFEPPVVVPKNQITFGSATLNIIGSGTPPTALDDSFAQGATTLDVLANDLAGTNGAPKIVQVGAVTPAGAGSVQIANGGLALQYSATNPNATVQFSYTIEDASGLRDTAVVTVNGTSTDNIINFRLQTTALDGTPITQIGVGQQFLLKAFVRDLRTSDPNPGLPGDQRGVFAGFLDVLYSTGKGNLGGAAVVDSTNNPAGFDLTCANEFARLDVNGNNIGCNIDTGLPPNADTSGLIDEVGAAVRDVFTPPGAAELPFFTAKFTATKAGTVSFVADPADIRSDVPPTNNPGHDSLVFFPTTPVGIAQIGYGLTNLNVVSAAGAAEGEFTNLRNRMDVNDDGFVSPIDVLLVVNELVTNGTRTLGEGEGILSGPDRIYPDVNQDLHVSPIDVALIVDYLSSRVPRNGEGESAATVAARSPASGDGSSAGGFGSDASGDETTASGVLGLSVGSNGGSSTGRSTRTPSDPTSTATDSASEASGTVAVFSTPAKASAGTDDDAIESILTDEFIEDILAGWEK